MLFIIIVIGTIVLIPPFKVLLNWEQQELHIEKEEELTEKPNHKIVRASSRYVTHIKFCSDI